MGVRRSGVRGFCRRRKGMCPRLLSVLTELREVTRGVDFSSAEPGIPSLLRAKTQSANGLALTEPAEDSLAT